MDSGSTTRLDGSSIVVVSGLYAVASAVAAAMRSPMMEAGGLGIGGWLMLVVGIVVLVHGILLLTPAVARLQRATGVLMTCGRPSCCTTEGCWRPDRRRDHGPAQDEALELLRRRFANGEIDAEEFEQRRSLLERR